MTIVANFKLLRRFHGLAFVVEARNLFFEEQQSVLVLLPDAHPELFTFCIYSLSSRIAGLPPVPILKIEECQWADFLHRYRYVKPSPLAESIFSLE